MKTSTAIQYTDAAATDPLTLEQEHRDDEPRYAISPLTGLPYVKARPGERKITSEEIYKMLEDFP